MGHLMLTRTYNSRVRAGALVQIVQYNPLQINTLLDSCLYMSMYANSHIHIMLICMHTWTIFLYAYMEKYSHIYIHTAKLRYGTHTYVRTQTPRNIALMHSDYAPCCNEIIHFTSRIVLFIRVAVLKQWPSYSKDLGIACDVTQFWLQILISGP